MVFTAVLIGHGRSPEGRHWGHRIDGCGLVLRMWDWHWQNRLDYGSRYDYGFFEAHPALVAPFHKYNRHEPRDGWVAVEVRGARGIALPPRTALISQDQWCETGRRLGGLGATGLLQLTRGTIAACWLIERASPGDVIVLVGFDNVLLGKTLDAEAGFPPEYRQQPSTFTFKGYKPDVRKYGNHDFGIERPLLEHLASARGVSVRFAQEIWPEREAPDVTITAGGDTAIRAGPAGGTAAGQSGDLGEDGGRSPAGQVAAVQDSGEGGAAPKVAEPPNRIVTPRRPSTALLLGDAQCVYEDAAAALKLFTPDVIAATNCIGIDWPEDVDHWFTLHPDRIGAWPGMATAVERRMMRGRNRPETWAHKPWRCIDRHTKDWAGGSGLFAIKGLREIGFERIALAGIPMTADQAHFYDPTQWSAAKSFQRAWRTRKAEIAPYVRSLSGWTRELLGEPTRDWLATFS